MTFTASPGHSAGWWIGTSVESFNGIYGNYEQANISEYFAQEAFGGTTTTTTIQGTAYTYYTNTPICWVGATAEPDLPGNEGAAYVQRWAQGLSTVECAWAGCNASAQLPYFLVVTDVFLTS